MGKAAVKLFACLFLIFGASTALGWNPIADCKLESGCALPASARASGTGSAMAETTHGVVLRQALSRSTVPLRFSDERNSPLPWPSNGNSSGEHVLPSSAGSLAPLPPENLLLASSIKTSQAIPEPTTALLLLAGLLGGLARRRNPVSQAAPNRLNRHRAA